LIEITKLSKKYRVSTDGSKSLSEFFAKSFRPKKEDDVWALTDINIRVKEGERVAILGHNGAGKSTLMGLIAGTLVPTSGEVEVKGSVVPLFGFSAGFDDRLSGADNLYLRAALFGLGREETTALLPEIAAFAELEEYLHRPVLSYSTGMKARLGFALSIQLKADVYLLDEALGAGDAQFRSKAWKALGERMKSHGTWIIVTHNPTSIEPFCHRGYLLNKGRIAAEGPFQEIAALYQKG